jgi:hypothetical protein
MDLLENYQVYKVRLDLSIEQNASSRKLSSFFYLIKHFLFVQIFNLKIIFNTGKHNVIFSKRKANKSFKVRGALEL